MTSTEHPGPARKPDFASLSEPVSARRTTGATVARGSLWEVAGLVLPQCYVVVASVFLARYLGPIGVGRVTLIAFVQFTVTTLLTLGLPVALGRYVGELVGSGKGAEVHVLARRAWSLALVAAGAALATLTAAGLLGASPQGAWLFAAVTAAGSVMQAIPSSVLRGLQLWREARIVGMTTGSVALCLKVGALVLGGGISYLFAIDAVIVIGNLVGTTMLARRAGRRLLPPPASDTTVYRDVLRFSGIASISIVISLIVYQRTEVFFLARFASDSEIAIYSIPFSIVGALLLLSVAIGSVLGPAVATLWGARELDRIRSGYSRALRLALLLNIVITALGASVGPVVIRVVYGSEFSGAGRVLVILLITLPAVPLSALSSSLLLGIGRQWGLTIIGAVAAVANIGLAFAFIPPYGAVGAAIANSLAQLVGAIPLVVYAARVIGGVSLHVGALVRVVAASAIAGLAATLVIHELAPIPGAVIGSIVFAITLAAASVILRPIAAEDGSWLAALAGERAQGRIGLRLTKAFGAAVEGSASMRRIRRSA